MINLEEEFEKLKQEALVRITQRETAGELSEVEAAQLAEMVYNRMYADSRPEEEKCPEGHGPNCGWSSSMGYHCY